MGSQHNTGADLHQLNFHSFLRALRIVPAMAEDDAIMKTRLLIDGDGMGDDRKINTLIRQIVKFATVSADETPEDARKAHDRIANVLAACEASEAKSALVREMNDAETRKYETLYTDIKNGDAEPLDSSQAS